MMATGQTFDKNLKQEAVHKGADEWEIAEAGRRRPGKSDEHAQPLVL